MIMNILVVSTILTEDVYLFLVVFDEIIMKANNKNLILHSNKL